MAKSQKKRKEVDVYNERSQQYEKFAANPEDRTMMETFKEAFATKATAHDIAKARKRQGY